MENRATMSAISVVIAIFWVVSFLASWAAGFQLWSAFTDAKSAPQQGAGAAMAAAMAIIPYCMARAVSELGKPR